MWKIRYDSVRPNVSPKLSGSYLSDLDARKAVANWLKQKYKPPVKKKFKYKTVGRPTSVKKKSKSSIIGWTPTKYKTPEQIQKMKEEYILWQKQNNLGS